jgi:hypothetical protein
MQGLDLFDDLGHLTPRPPGNGRSTAGSRIMKTAVGTAMPNAMMTGGAIKASFRIDGKEMVILGICHRKEVYPPMESRQRNPR